MPPEATQTGAEVAVTNVDTAAQALMQRYEAAEVSEEPAPIEAQEPEQDVPEQEEVPTEDTDEVEEVEASDEASDEEDAIEDEAETRFETLAELAEATGMDQDEFLKQIKATVKVEGEQGEATLAEILKGYQLESTFTKKNEAFINERKQWEAQRDEVQAKLNSELQRAGQAFGIAQQQLTHEFSAINWEQLQKDNPQDYLIKRQQFGERQAQLDQAINQASAHAQSVLEAQQAEQAEKDQQYLQQENEMLLERLPEWKDETVRAKGVTEVAEFLQGNGFSPEDIAGIKDHRLILLAKKAMGATQAATDADVVAKKVKKAPKLVKPNARQQVNPNEQRIRKLKAQAKKSGKVDDIAQLLLARGN